MVMVSYRNGCDNNMSCDEGKITVRIMTNNDRIPHSKLDSFEFQAMATCNY